MTTDKSSTKEVNFQDLVTKLNEFWANQGAIIGQPYGLEVGAATGNPNTFFRSLGDEPINIAYIEPCRRPTDGRYGENPNRFGHYFQYQILLKPAPRFNTELYINMLMHLGIDPTKHDIRFVEDNWESIPLGAWGLGWEIWLDGMEITQYTYFQQIAGIPLTVPALEITIGLERLAMYLQDVKHYKDLMWNDTIRYADLFKQHEFWQSTYNYETSDPKLLHKLYSTYQQSIEDQLKKGNYWAAYDYLLKLSHTFNLLDAKGLISLTDRTAKFKEMANFSNRIGKLYLKERKKLKYPLKDKSKSIEYTPQDISLKDLDIKFETIKEKETNEKNLMVLELGFEEIPASLASKWYQNIKNANLSDLLKDYGLTGDISIGFTPRRIVIIIKNYKLTSVTKKIKGPISFVAYKDNKPTDILTKFLKKHGARENQITIQEINGKNFVFINITQNFKIEGIIKILISTILNKAPQSKTMSYFKGQKSSIIRPLRWILALKDNEIIDIELPDLDVKSSNYTLTPRYSLPHRVLINKAIDYLTFLKFYSIQLNPEERAKAIRTKLLKKDVNVSMLNENIFLTESPHILFEQLPKKYYQLPEKLIYKILEKNQRYLITKDGDKILYGVVINHNKDQIFNHILKGNKKVVNARLDDGLFYLKKDIAKDLKSYRPMLNSIVFHPKAGSFLDKVERIKTLTYDIYKRLNLKEPKYLKDVLALIKNDKATLLGSEFPELEGYIAEKIAQLQGYPRGVYIHLSDYYNDEFVDVHSAILALADELDSIKTLAKYEPLPTSTKDPFQFRQKTYRIIKILDIKHAKFKDKEVLLNLDILQILKANFELTDFINKRLLNYLKDMGINHNIALAITQAQDGKLGQKILNAYKIASFDNKTVESIFDTIKRVKNILRKANTNNTDKNKYTLGGMPTKIINEFGDKSLADTSWGINVNLLTTKGERLLYSFLMEHKDNFQITDIINLAQILETFFEDTLVMHKNLRLKKNRLKLLDILTKLVSKHINP